MKSNSIRPVLAGVAILAASMSANAADVSYSGTAPTVDGSDIAYLGAGATSDAENINGGDDFATYVAGNQPGKGQTFTTGSNLTGYTLTSITLQHVTYGDTFWDVTGGLEGDYEVEVGTIGPISDEDPAPFFTTFYEEFAAPGGAGNFGAQNPGTGTGTFVTFTFDTPVVLLPDSEYGFSVYNPGSYFETNGLNSDVAPGIAFSNGGGFVTEFAGADRIFHLDLAANAIPEPTSVGLLGTAGIGLLLRRKRS